MFRPLTLIAAAALALGLLADSAVARNPAFYGTPRGVSARTYSGAYQAYRPNTVRTFSLPAYGGGGYYAPYHDYGYDYSYDYSYHYGRRGYYPVYQQPVIIYPARVTYGFGF